LRPCHPQETFFLHVVLLDFLSIMVLDNHQSSHAHLMLSEAGVPVLATFTCNTCYNDRARNQFDFFVGYKHQMDADNKTLASYYLVV
jgi:hypothetical protein